MTALEDSRNSVSIVSVDFSKAFNRMSHYHCLQAFKFYGASTESLAMIAAFLQGRIMSIKVGNAMSTPRNVLGGSPQGTKMGNYLFTITIDCIEQKNHPLYLRGLDNDRERINNEEEGGETTTEDENDTTLPTRPPNHSSTPYKAGTSDGVIRYLDESGRGCSIMVNTTPSSPYFSPPTNWKTIDPWVDKYVDLSLIHI